jgi:hypothetical protein
MIGTGPSTFPRTVTSNKNGSAICVSHVLRRLAEEVTVVDLRAWPLSQLIHRRVQRLRGVAIRHDEHPRMTVWIRLGQRRRNGQTRASLTAISIIERRSLLPMRDYFATVF